MTRARILIDTPLGPPFWGASSTAAFYMRKALVRMGYKVEVTIVAPASGIAGSMIPLEGAHVVSALRKNTRGELRIFTDRSLQHIQPDIQDRALNVLYFHGLRYGSGAFLRGERFQGYCADSDYLRRTLLMLLLFPGSNLRGDLIVGSVPEPLGALDFPDGYPSGGEKLSSELRQLLAGDDCLGHALRPLKPDPVAIVSILHAMQTGKRATRLFVSASDLQELRLAAFSLGLENTLAFLHPVPWLANRELVSLMRRCDFALLYDRFPEPFGLYPLESVLQGTPVYTNGAGNLRHLLPPRCGIRVEDHDDFNGIGKRILRDVLSGSGRRACVRGARLIRTKYGHKAFFRGFSRYVEQITGARPTVGVDPASLKISLGPLVRAYDPRSGRCKSDYRHVQLDRSQRELLRQALGSTLRTIARDSSLAGKRDLHRLFRCGLLSLGEGLQDPVRLRNAHA